MRRVMFLVIPVAACGGDDPECGVAFEKRPDGLCYQLGDDDTAVDTGTIPDETVEDPAEFSLSEVLDSLTCEGLPPSGSGTLDLEAGCVAGGCADATYTELNDAYGEEGPCESFRAKFGEFVFSQATCTWGNGVSASFEDLDLDGLPDESSSAFSLDVDPPNADSSAEGLGLGVSMGCFLDVHGHPQYASFDRLLDGWVPVSMRYATFSISDISANDGGGFEADGLVDGIGLTGP